jgi:putative nucleotidyltransferase with HDIG domain
MSAALSNLLRHLSHCHSCEGAACDSYRRLAQRVADQQSPIAVHLTEEAVEEYCFGRLPSHLMDWCRRHMAACEPCRRRVQMNALSIITLQNAFLLLSSRTRRSVPPISICRNGAIPEPRFSDADLLGARERIPISRHVAARCLAVLQNEGSSLSEIEAVVSDDPVIAAHLMRVANSALLASRREIRTLGAAILHLGFGRTKVHIWALSSKSLFTSPHLREVWNHSVQAAKVARNLAIASGVVDRDEACLAGLVHDVGQLVLTGLGCGYVETAARLRAQGHYPVEIERRLCGSSHAGIGADLLDSWCFPAEIVEAVRHHHTPSSSQLPLTSLLFAAESWIEAPEDVFSPREHTAAMERLQLNRRDLARIAQQCTPDLDLLRIAA